MNTSTKYINLQVSKVLNVAHCLKT